MNQKLKLGAIIVLVVGATTVFQLQQGKMKRLVAENADLSTQLNQLVSLQQSNEILATQLKAAVELSESNQRELSRLRGQGGRVRQVEQENIQLKAQHQQLALQVLESQSATADEDFASNVAKRLQHVKVAVVDFYAKYGSLPTNSDCIEPMLTSEGFLKESMPQSSNIRTRTVETSAPTAPITSVNQAYSFDGNLTNSVFGELVVEAVVANITGRAARNLSLALDGETMTSPIGEADLTGRVKFAAIPGNAVGEVHVYLTHH